MHWEHELKSLIEAHVKETHSRWGATILANWENKRDQFWQIVPKEMLNRLSHPISDLTEDKALSA